MLKYLRRPRLRPDSLFRILIQALQNEVLCFVRYHNPVLGCVGEYGIFLLNQIVHFLGARAAVAAADVEGRESDEHFVDEDSEAPPVDGEGVSLLIQNLRSQILRCATERLGYFVWLQRLCQAEISHGNVSVLVYQNVFWLQIPIDNTLFVQVSQCHGDLEGIKLSPLL